MTGPGAVVAIVMLEWAAGLVAGAAWAQSWGEIKRGHFRIVAWSGAILALCAMGAWASTSEDGWASGTWSLGAIGAIVAFAPAQYLRSDRVGTAVGAAAGLVGAGALLTMANALGGWPAWLAGLHLVGGALLLGGVTNGMLLGHWYLNQPGLRPAALARLTSLSLAGVAVTLLLGLAGMSQLTSASTQGAALGLPGFGSSFGVVFFGAWVAFAVFTGVIVWMARRCVAIRSIQSATGLYYVALLTAGVSEFLVRYLMVQS